MLRVVLVEDTDAKRDCEDSVINTIFLDCSEDRELRSSSEINKRIDILSTKRDFSSLSSWAITASNPLRANRNELLSMLQLNN